MMWKNHLNFTSVDTRKRTNNRFVRAQCFFENRFCRLSTITMRLISYLVAMPT